MQLEFHAVASLPPLAWLARLRSGDPTVRILHGSSVETWPDAFVEGAWDAPFAERDFERSPVLAGSGGRLAARGIRFASPANPYERLHSIRRGDELLVSNSLAFLLAASGDRLDPEHRHYSFDFLDHHRVGIREKEKRLRLTGGRSVELHDCCNLDVDPQGEIVRVEKPWGPPPSDYAAYVDLLARTLRRVIDNADAEERKQRYRPVVTVSQGYDTTAVAALASRAGCREAVTFHRSAGDEGYVDDGGEAIAAHLGLEVTAYERNDYRTAPDFAAEEFFVDPWGTDRCMAVMETQLAGSLLLSGRWGEVVWTRGKGLRYGLPDLQHAVDIGAGYALGEFRLRVGFLHFPPATIAAIHAPIIHGWNASPEMRPWSIGGAYDKPIARRIAESAGIPRELFGQKKRGGVQGARAPKSTLLHRLVRRGPIPRALVLGIFGDRYHPRWKRGSFEVQAGAERLIDRYRQALVDLEPHG